MGRDTNSRWCNDGVHGSQDFPQVYDMVDYHALGLDESDNGNDGMVSLTLEEEN